MSATSTIMRTTRTVRTIRGLIACAALVAALGATQRAEAHGFPVRIDVDYGLDGGWRAWVSHLKRQMDRAPKGTKFAYLSGPISTGGRGSIEDNLKYGAEVTNKLRKDLRAKGYEIISPFEIEQFRVKGGQPISKRLAEDMKFWQHATFMKMWSEVVSDARVTQIILLPDAEYSVGGMQELAWFINAGRKVFRYGEAASKKQRGKKGGVRGKGYSLRRVAYTPLVSQAEHTVLKPTTKKEVVKEARWAAKNRARAMVVRPEHVGWVTQAVKAAKGSMTVPTSVVGFPTEKFTELGWVDERGPQVKGRFYRVKTGQKSADAQRAIAAVAKAGGDRIELDMIIDVHGLKLASQAAAKKQYVAQRRFLDQVERDINEVINTARIHGERKRVNAKVKVILETSLLTAREIQLASAIVRKTEALSVKTSTGYGTRGASERDIRLIKGVVGDTKLIKASGGVTPATMGRLRQLGAHIFGMSATRQLNRPGSRRAHRKTWPRPRRRSRGH